MHLLFRKFAALLLGAALASAPAAAQQALPTPQRVEAVPAPVTAHPALWKVADADTTIYLFGTIHLLPAGIDWLDGPVASAFEQSGELVTEIPELDQTEAQTVVLRHGVLPKGQTLRGLMTKRELARFDAAMQQFGLPVTAFDRFKPWYAGVILGTLPLKRGGFQIENGVEQQLADRGRALGKPRAGLETLDYQLGLFDSFPPKVQKRYLFEVIDALPTLDSHVAAMIKAWQDGDAAKLAGLMNADEDDPMMVTTLLTNRNKTWAQWIAARLDRPGTVFVAVGAGHLGGKGSVQDQLAKAGITAVRVQ